MRNLIRKIFGVNIKIKKAKYLNDYKIELIFSDGVAKVVNFKPFLKNAKNLFVPLLDLNYFKSFSVDDTTIRWPNEVDFCPDVLYEVGEEIHEQKTPIRRKSAEASRFNYQATYESSLDSCGP